MFGLADVCDKVEQELGLEGLGFGRVVAWEGDARALFWGEGEKSLA